MHYLSFWQSALVLVAVPLVHWLWLHRGFGVSGRYSALVDWLRGKPSTGEPTLAHALFFGGVLLGGFASAWLRADPGPSFALRGELFAHLVHGSPWLRVGVPLVGGLFVGFGTRMAGGCTSGHGLCGVSQMQGGSLLSTAAFFGAGVATSLALRVWL